MRCFSRRSIIGAAHYAKYFGLKDVKFFVFDTFEGFSQYVETDFGGQLPTCRTANL